MSSSQRSKNSLTSSAHKAAERQFTVTETPLHDFMGDSDLTIQKPHGSKNRPHRPPRRSVPHDSPLSLPLCLTNNSNEKTNTTGSSTWSDIPSEFPEPLTKESWSTLASSQGFGAAHETSDPMATLIHAPMNFQLTTTGGNICDIYEHELKFVDEPTFYLNYSRSQMVNIHNWASQHFSLRGQECPVLSEWEAQAMDPQKTSSSGPSYNSIQEATVVSNNHYQGFPWQHLSTVSEPSSTLDFLYDDLIVGAMTEPGMASPASMPESTPPSTADASPMQSVHSPTHDVSAIIATSCMQTLITAAPSLKIPVVPVHTHGEFVPQTTTTALAPVDTKVIDAMDVSRLYHERKGAQNGEWTTKGSTNPLLMSEVWPTCHLSMPSLEMFPLSNQSLYTLSSSVSSSTDLSSSASMRTNYPSTPPEHGTTNYESTELRVAAATTDHTMEWTVPGSAPVVMSNSNSNSNGNGNGTSSSNSSYDKAPWITHIPLQDRDAVFDSNVYTCSDEELSRSIQYYEQLVEQKKMRLSLQRHWKLQQQQLLQQQQQQQQL
ncbi:hypothetical protein BGZ50_002224 [Haplosporangium sp. Z 11]|nr:hypothetical protein BGZ50_002224 [Haplosporangium sp. Z 11]